MKKKYEFKPDSAGAGLMQRLYLPPRQRQQILKWFLLGLVCVFLQVLQDVIFSRVRIFDATTDLLAVALFIISVQQGADSSCIFLLVMALIYQFSGSSPGSYVVIALPLVGVVISAFRESFLRSSFSSTLLCVSGGLIVYELIKFLIGLLTGSTAVAWLRAFLLTALLSAALVPVLDPLMRSIGKIGGDKWKE